MQWSIPGLRGLGIAANVGMACASVGNLALAADIDCAGFTQPVCSEYGRPPKAPFLGSDRFWYVCVWNANANRAGKCSRDATFPQFFKFTDKSEFVSYFQELLKKHKHDVNVNGEFDAPTIGAVIEFQKEQGLRVDGLIGKETLDALRK